MAIITVTTANDVVDSGDGVTSLREALTIAQGSAGADTIVFGDGFTRVDLSSALTIAAGDAVTINGDRNGDGVADIILDGNYVTNHVVVQAGATANLVSLNFVAGRNYGTTGINGSTGADGVGGENGIYTYGGNGGQGYQPDPGTDGGDAAGSIMNYGTLSVVRSQFAANRGNSGIGGFGGTGGNGGNGGQGGNGNFGGNSGYRGGDGGTGGTGGNGGNGGDAAGAIFNAAGATLNLTDTGFGHYINTTNQYAGQNGTVYYGSNFAQAGRGGTGGTGGIGGGGGTGGAGAMGTYYAGYYVGDPGYGGYYVPPRTGQGGNGGDGGGGGPGGDGGTGGNSGRGAGAILNFGVINTTTNQSMGNNGFFAYASGGYGGAYGGGGSGGGGGTAGYGTPNGYVGTPGPNAGGGLPGAAGGAGFGADDILNLEGGVSAVATTDVIYYIYAPVSQVTEGTGGTTTLTFFVNRMGTPFDAETVSWSVNAVSGGLNGSDFTGGALASGTFDFSLATNQFAIVLNIATDALAELSETFTVNLTGVTDTAGGFSHGLGTASASVTIVNDDPLVARFTNGTFATLVQNYTANNAFAEALAAATAGQGVDVLAEAVLGNVGAASVTANALTVRADAPFNAALTMSGSAVVLTLAGNANMSVTGNSASSTVTGNAGNNAITGLGNADTLNGGAGADTLGGGGGADLIVGGAGGDSMTGGAGGDRFDLNSVAEIGNAAGSRDIITDFQQGLDVIDLDDIDALTTLAGVQRFTWLGTAAHTGAGATLRYQQSGGNTLVYGDVDANGSADFTLQLNGLINLTANDFTDLAIAVVQGTAVGETLGGSNGSELILGLNGNDTLSGLGGTDTLRGGGGTDTQTGGSGADVFDFDAAGEIGLGATRDIITDFQQGVDLIDFDAIDALTTVAGIQHFTFLGTGAHTGAGATLRYQQSGGNTLLYGDIDANGTADFALQLNGLVNLTAADFTDLSIATVQGTAAGESLAGSGGVELIAGLGGNDTLVAGAGADTLRGGEGADLLTGGADSDRFDFDTVAEIGNASGSRDVIADFQQGVDKIDLDGIDALTTLAGVQHFTWLGTAGHTGAGATLRFQQSGGNTLVYGDVDANGTGDFTLQLTGLFTLTASDFTNLSVTTIQGTAGNDTLVGAPGGKEMLGLDGSDTIGGGAGADTIVGGAAADSLTGGLGADLFKWNAPTHTGVNAGTRDIVTDFQQGLDTIDLSAIDANTTVAGNQAFLFLGTGAHTGAGATLRFQQSGGNTIVFGDINADAAADFAIQLTGLFTLTAADFVL